MNDLINTMQNEWIITAIVAAVVGLIVGFIFGRVGRGKANGSSAAGVQKKHAQYQDDVRSHFAETSALIQTLTDDYKKVYDHLASGAEVLCEGDDVAPAPKLDWEGERSTGRKEPTVGNLDSSDDDQPSAVDPARKDAAVVATQLASQASADTANSKMSSADPVPSAPKA